MEENCNLLLTSVSDCTKCLKLINGSAFTLGRNRETQIKDTRCSRVQLLLTPDFKNRDIVVEQIGSNPSVLNGNRLQKGEKRKAYHNDIIEVLESDYCYKIEFLPATASVKTTVDSNKNVNSSNKDTDSATKTNNVVSNRYQGSLDYFLKDSALEPTGSWGSVKDDSLITFSSNAIESCEKIGAFDLDGTIITTMSGHVYPKDTSDWKIQFPNTIEKLKELHAKKYKIVLFTNQGGIGNGRIKLKDYKKKIEAIARKLPVPVHVFIAAKDDIHRKPRIGMWQYLSDNKNNNIEINLEESFYCGDAAGRPANCEPKKNKKDFSSSDRLFAINLNLKFFTPEEYFLNWKTAPFKLPEFRPSALSPDKPLLEPETSLISNNVEIVVMVGCPGSGKSFFSKTYLQSSGYVHVNRDTLKTWQKCVALTEKSIRSNSSVVVDNTSPDKESRARYINIGKELNVPVRAFWMTTSLDHAKHNNTFRRLTDETRDLIANYSINNFYAIIEPPVLDEGFTEIVRVNCVPRFKNEKEKQLYNMYLFD